MLENLRGECTKMYTSFFKGIIRSHPTAVAVLITFNIVLWCLIYFFVNITFIHSWCVYKNHNLLTWYNIWRITQSYFAAFILFIEECKATILSHHLVHSTVKSTFTCSFNCHIASLISIAQIAFCYYHIVSCHLEYVPFLRLLCCVFS